MRRTLRVKKLVRRTTLIRKFKSDEEYDYVEINSKYINIIKMKNTDIRWEQRFSNYQKALAQLGEFMAKSNDLNKFEKQGFIKAFEYTYELAWNTIKDFYEYQGEAGIQGSRDAIQIAFNRDLIKDGEGWMQMLKDRNLTSHVYNEEVAEDIAKNINEKYYNLIRSLEAEINKQLN